MAKRPAAAQTAFGPMVIVAAEQHQPSAHRLIEDDLAGRFLPPGMRFTVWLSRWRVMRDLLMRFSENEAPGLWGGVLCRKCYADEKVRAAVAAGVDAVVILGAGLDTRGYRLAAPEGVPVFEVDLPPNIDYKRAKLHDVFGGVPDHVTLVPVDFDTDDLAQALAAHGFRIEHRTMFVWEAVTQYLTPDGVRATLAVLAKAGAGSGLVVTYIRQDFIDGTNLYGAERIYQRMRIKYQAWHFGVAPDQLAALLAEFGWTVREDLGRTELTARFVEPAGRAMPVSDIERSVYADKP